jgi:uncharacterized protein YdhG (YjbR/CyaY superfamily)
MAKTNFRSVDEYIAAQPRSVRSQLERVRGAILKAVPKAEEMISYQMPFYRLNGGRLIYFAAWKKHYSLYPATRTLLAAFQDDLAPYEIEKSTIRFSYSRPVPGGLIGRMAKFRARELAGRV